MIRLALLGAGRIGQVHARNAVASDKVDLVAICDAVEQAARDLAAPSGTPVRSLDKVIDDPLIDAVLIGTSTDTHADISERAAAAGKAIFCEKPIDLSAERARLCVERVAAAGVPFFVGFNRRFDPSFADLRRRVQEGHVGEIEILSITSRDPSPPPVAFLERSGGFFRDMMIHDFDMACWIMDETPVEVYATASALVSEDIARVGDVDTAAAVLKFSSGRICQISNSRRTTYGYDQRIEVHGSKGMLLADNRRETTIVHAGAHGFATDPAQPFFLERYAEAYRLELDAFATYVESGQSPEPSGADGVRGLVLADAAVQSSETGEPVRVETI